MNVNNCPPIDKLTAFPLHGFLGLGKVRLV